MPSPDDIRLIAEWEHQTGLLLTWPAEHADWHATRDAIEKTLTEVIISAAHFQPVKLLCSSVPEALKLNHLFEDLTKHRVETLIIPSNDIWIRDYGPLRIEQYTRTRYHSFAFNAWGEKYDYQLDASVCQQLERYGLLPGCTYSPFVLEGGAIDSDGLGTALVTQSALTHPSRNGEQNCQAVEHVLSTSLGITRTLWLQTGELTGDDTDGHIDMLARFTAPNHICYQACDDSHHPCYSALQHMANELAEFKQANGEPYQLTPLPWPSASGAHSAFPLSYANFVIINHAVLVPQYNVSSDGEALRTLAKALPHHEIIGIDCRVLITQGGGLHCASAPL